MIKIYFTILFIGFTSLQGIGQSLEIMTGHDRIFVDVQWLKFIDADKQWSIFSRSYASVDYDNQTDLFTTANLNYTFKKGLGASIAGKISRNGGGADVGIHVFKASANWMLFGLASLAVKNRLEYSWFSIFRFTPLIKGKWRLYSSFELFHLFAQEDHLVSAQRIRLGLDYQGFQFGVAGNFTELGNDWTSRTNIGVFIRKSF